MRDIVIGLLNMDMNDMSRIAVVVYGVGGIGKITLAIAVFKKLDLSGYKFCRVDIEQDCSVDYLKLLQKQILLDLFGKNIDLRSCEEGNQQLMGAFRKVKQPLFMFVDNALGGSDLACLLPKDLSSLPKQIKILITTRKLNETDLLIHRDILLKEFSMDCLSEVQSKEMLCEKALCGPGSKFPHSADIDGLVKLCGGILLVQEMIASKLKRHVNNVPLCNEMVKLLKESLTQGEGDMSEKVVDVVYNILDEGCREAFLDIAYFFHNMTRHIVAYVVGLVELQQALEDAVLVKIFSSEKENYTDKIHRLQDFVS